MKGIQRTHHHWKNILKYLSLYWHKLVYAHVYLTHKTLLRPSDLTRKGAQQRNEKIHKLVDFVSSGDATSYMEYILKTYPEEIDEALEGSEYYQHFMKTFKINCRKEVDVKDAAGILAGKCELSQRRYKALREVLQNSNVLLPSYDIVSTYVKGIDVGHLYPLHEKNACECMGYGSSLNDSLQQMVNNDLVYNKLEFLTEEKQKKLGDFLKLNDPKLYKNFNYSEKTLFFQFNLWYLENGFCLGSCKEYPIVKGYNEYIL